MNGRTRTLLRRWHIWLGWIVALPFLVWTVSGLVMVVRPIEEVRGEHLIGEAPGLPGGLVPVPPPIGPRPVESLKLEQRHDGPRWIVSYADGGHRLADAASGRLLPALTASDAAGVVEARYAGAARVKTVDRISADDPPIELRRSIESWRVTMTDNVRFYVDASTGEIIATRTPFWRLYDFMWGLHIMDPGARKDSNNMFVIGFGAFACLTTLLAAVLLPLTLRRRSRDR